MKILYPAQMREIDERSVELGASVLQLMEKWNWGLHVAVPLMGVNLVLIAIDEWHESRGAAIFSLCCAAFVFACSAAVWFLH